MSVTFGAAYARAYDALYEEKDYESECDLLLGFLRDGDGEVHRILDLGCGTGSHALVLGKRGIDVVGVDRSADMINVARQKAAEMPADHRPSFVVADIGELRLAERFDVVLMMFAVLGYQRTNEEVSKALATARAHLDAGGLLAFDVWYGPAVLSEGPSQRIKLVETDAKRIIRVASSNLDTRNHLCTVDYRLWALEGARLAEEVTESHPMRFFFPLELELFLDQAGFSLLRLGGFPDFYADPNQSTWNALALAQAL